MDSHLVKCCHNVCPQLHTGDVLTDGWVAWSSTTTKAVWPRNMPARRSSGASVKAQTTRQSHRAMAPLAKLSPRSRRRQWTRSSLRVVAMTRRFTCNRTTSTSERRKAPLRRCSIKVGVFSSLYVDFYDFIDFSICYLLLWKQLAVKAYAEVTLFVNLCVEEVYSCYGIYWLGIVLLIRS